MALAYKYFANIGLCALISLAAGCGGGGGENPGPPPPPQPTITSGTVSPSSVTVEIGRTQQFTATVNCSVAGQCNSAVTWYVNDIAGGNSTVGSISSAGLYTAPSSIPSPASATVKATSVQDATKSGFTGVALSQNPAAMIRPRVVTLPTDYVQLFLTYVDEDPNNSGLCSVNGIQGGNATIGRVERASGFTEGWGARAACRYFAPAVLPPPQTVSVEFNRQTAGLIVETVSSIATIVPDPIGLDWSLIGNPAQSDTPQIASGIGVDRTNNIFVVLWRKVSDAYVPRLAKYDPDGKQLCTLDFSPSPDSIAPEFALDAAGTGFFLTGDVGDWPNLTGWLARVNADCTLDFAKTFQLDGNLTAVFAIRRFQDKLYLAAYNGDRRPEIVTMNLNGNLLARFSAIEDGFILGLWVEADHILASGDFYFNGDFWNMSGWVRKFDLAGNLAWKKMFPDLIHVRVVEDSSGFIYVGGKELNQMGPGTPPVPAHYFVAKLDAQGNEVWRRLWEGDNKLTAEFPDTNSGNWVNGFLLDPRGGVVILGELNELGLPEPNSTDFGALEVDANGNFRWKLRRDFGSYRDNAHTGALDQQGRLVLAGHRMAGGRFYRPDDTGRFVIAKFRVP